MRAFRFGVTHAGPPDLASWTATARRVESLGYHTFLVPDTLNTPPPLLGLAAAAAVTSTLRVGLGLGAGRPAAGQDARRLGLPFGTGAERAARLRASVPLIRGLLDGAEPGFPGAGQHVGDPDRRLRAAAAGVRGGRSRHRLRLAARYR